MFTEFLNKVNMKNLTILLSLFILSTFSYAQKEVNIDFNYNFSNFSYCGFYEFYIDKNTDKLENDLFILKKQYEENNFFENDTNQIKILSSIHFDWNQQKQTIIYYKEMKNEFENYRFFYADTTYKNVLENIQNILILKNDYFWEFYNSENNSAYPEINALKPLIKDTDGVLNIFKLSKTIEENRSLLDGYLEE